MFHAVKEFKSRKEADALLVPCWQRPGKKGAEWAAKEKGVKTPVEVPLTLGDFRADLEETSVVYLDGLTEPRVILVGLGERDKMSADAIRFAYAAAVKQCRTLRLKKVNVLLPHMTPSDTLTSEEVIKAGLDGFVLANYSYDALKGKGAKEPTALLERISLIHGASGLADQIGRAEKVSKGVQLTRDLINGNADQVTPSYLGEVAKGLAKKYEPLKATVWDRRRLEREGMGLLLAVSRGATEEPAFIVLEYQGSSSNQDLTVLVGKGVTYDTGGLNLKPTGYMETMKTDMSGAATVFGVIEALAALKLPVNVTAVVAATENAIDGCSYKPGDVYTSYSGHTVEIANTDAEGRLTLADALAYSVKEFKPNRIIDLATLTGAVVVALGEEVAGMMGNNSELLDAIQACGDAVGEVCWPLPLPERYKKQLKSHIADYKNCGDRKAGSIVAGLFLQEFVQNGVEKAPAWAHLDIAGTAYPDKALGCHTGNATGFGVRLLIEFLEGLAKQA